MSGETKLLLIKELADLIKVPESTIRYWIFTRKIPFQKVGKSIRFNMKKIEVWLEKQEFSQEEGLK